MTMKMLAAALFSLGVTACASPAIEQYRSEEPPLDLRSYLNGQLDAWGMFQTRSGAVQKRFHATIDARWNGDNGVLDERFQWSDGTTSRRVWTLTRQADGSFRGRADDVVGEAVGQLAGNALHWRYVLALPVDGKVWQVDFDDWMFLMDDRVMLNRSTMSKWGVELGEVTLTFIKR
jgi:hypothetical protein